MSEQIKFVLQELNLPPFKLNYNLIVFDQLSGENRLQAREHLSVTFKW